MQIRMVSKRASPGINAARQIADIILAGDLPIGVSAIGYLRALTLDLTSIAAPLPSPDPGDDFLKLKDYRAVLNDKP